ncbi:MAG: DUF951 domain-containing protein [Schwartzia sp.]|nr:DUF951 domain-containing protein [Schwartzia sp. (in: firmicutes)]
MERVHYDVGDIVRMKKKHPCGSDEWRLTRVGMDFGMRCQGCDHFVMIPRVKFEKMCRAIVKKSEESASGEASQDRNTGKN